MKRILGFDQPFRVCHGGIKHLQRTEMGFDTHSRESGRVWRYTRDVLQESVGGVSGPRVRVGPTRVRSLGSSREFLRQHLLVHRGRAVVFNDIEDFHARIDDNALDTDETCVMVLKNCGPKGYPGMAEVGNMILPPSS